MIAISNNVREMIEIRKFAVQVEEVLFVQIEDKKYPGNYITEEERTEHKLSKYKERDELWTC